MTCTATMAIYYFFYPPLTGRAMEIEMQKVKIWSGVTVGSQTDR